MCFRPAGWRPVGGKEGIVSTAELLRALLATPLVGRGRERAAGLLAELAEGGELPAWRLEGETGVLLFYGGQLGASDRLLAGVKGAEEAGETGEVLRYKLLAARALAAVGRAASASELLGEVPGPVWDDLALGPEARLAAAAIGHPDARRLWEEALPRLASPARDADRLEVLLGLGIMARAGGDVTRARRAWEQALGIARAHEDDRERLRLSALLGNLLVEVGLLAEAEARLQEAVEVAERLDEPLILLAEGTVLAALQLGREDWAGAEATGAKVAAAAAKRNNYAGIAEAAITRASARLAADDVTGALTVMWEAATLLQERGGQVGLNLLKARLGEIRVLIGPESFDPIWVAFATGRKVG